MDSKAERARREANAEAMTDIGVTLDQARMIVDLGEQAADAAMKAFMKTCGLGGPKDTVLAAAYGARALQFMVQQLLEKLEEMADKKQHKPEDCDCPNCKIVAEARAAGFEVIDMGDGVYAVSRERTH